MDNKVHSLEYLLCFSNSWEEEENLRSSCSLLISSYSEGLQEETIKVEENSNVTVNECNTKTVRGKKRKSSEKRSSKNGLLRKSRGRKGYECEECNKKLTRNLSRECPHFRKRQPIKQNFDEKPTLKPSLMNGSNIDYNGRDFVCSVCDKAFRQKCTLRRHMTTHTGVKPHSCSFCAMSFYQKDNLRRHETTHTKEEKPFQCDKCIRSFHSRSALNEHDFSHTGTSRHFCDTCGVYFSNSGSLKRHVKNVHITKQNMPAQPAPCKCEKCGQAFRDIALLEKHTKFHCYYTALEALRTKRLGVSKLPSS